MTRKFLLASICALGFLTGIVSGQSTETRLEKQMIEYEYDVVQAYHEIQNYLIESNTNQAELIAFEKLMSVYVERIFEIYSTLRRLKGYTLETYRAVVARALIIRALTYLERADISPENYQKACRDYQKALTLYQKTNQIPIMNKRLPYEIWIGGKLYTRLVDLLDDRGKGFQLYDCLRQKGIYHNINRETNAK
ncbi:hypothetical protein JXJ21_06630 [candidate division KSB1 bacterium]|nr:hypothetical protein [candidate division KSB1 bacterium]